MHALARLGLTTRADRHKSRACTPCGARIATHSNVQMWPPTRACRWKSSYTQHSTLRGACLRGRPREI
eukprot:5069469-Pleurochrysis_carterae.AAC.1